MKHATMVLTALVVMGLLLSISVSAQPVIHTVNVGDFFFNPTKTMVAPGDAVRYVFVSGTHSSTADATSPKFWDSGVQTTGFYDVTFLWADGPGPFPYHCSVHPATMQDTIFWAPGVFNSQPNLMMAGPPTDQINATVANSDVTPMEVYSTWTDFQAPGIAPSLVGFGYSPMGGSPGTWMSFINPPPFGFTEEWNSTISGNPLGGYLMTSTPYVFPPYIGAGGVVMTPSAGGGTPFVGAVMLMANNPGIDWIDYSTVEYDEHPGNPPINFGTSHMAWVQFLEGGDGDPDGNGNQFDDAADGYTLWYSYSNAPASPGAFPFPAFMPPVPIFGGPVFAGPGALAMQRPSLDVAGVTGTPAMPPGAAYVAWPDIASGAIMVDAAEFGAGVPFGTLTGGFGPVAAMPFIPLPPVLNGNIKGATTVSVAVDNGPMCPGRIYIAWSDFGGGDADIFFSASLNGGVAWTPPVRVNQDPIANGRDQWAPAMKVDQITGDITISYFDRRNDPANFLVEQWTSTSIDCGLTWTDCMLSDAGPTPPVGSYAPNGIISLGDYVGIDVNGFGWAYTWNDGRNGMNQDVFFDTQCAQDLDLDGFVAGIDCDDTNPTIYPGAPEIPNDGIDQDCNGVDAILCYNDADTDGFGDAADPGTIDLSGSCSSGKVSNNLDCDDTQKTVYPGAPEIPNDGIDQDCNGADAILCYNDVDTDGFGDLTDPGTVDLSGFCQPGKSSNNLDCDDNDNTIYPGAPEVPGDGVDQDCNGVDAILCYADADTDGFGDQADPGTVDLTGFCPTGKVSNNLDCDDSNPAINPTTVWYQDLDSDTYGNPLVSLTQCVQPPGYVLDNTDCDDTDPTKPPCGCCLLRGDVDHSGAINVSDLTYLVAYLFSGGPPPPCVDEGDVDGSGAINVSDLTFLVAYLFSGGPPPPPC